MPPQDTEVAPPESKKRAPKLAAVDEDGDDEKAARKGMHDGADGGKPAKTVRILSGGDERGGTSKPETKTHESNDSMDWNEVKRSARAETESNPQFSTIKGALSKLQSTAVSRTGPDLCW